MARPGPEEDDQDAEVAPAGPSALKQIVHYALLGFAPFVAALALMFALISITRIPAMQTKVSDAETRVQKIGADLDASRIELKKLKDALQQEKAERQQDNLKRAELATQVVHDVTQLQTKLKIHPTLEQQMNQATGASAVPATAPIPGPAAPQAGGKDGGDGQAKAMLEAIRKFNGQ